MLTHQRLKDVLHYDPETGIFTWMNKIGSKSAGSFAGTLTRGRIKIMIDKCCYMAHRLAWFYMTGQFPLIELDHIDNDGTNNRWINLRESSHSLNMQNQRKAHKQNKTGLLGVHKQGSKYRTRIRVNGKNLSLGMFSSPEKAHKTYIEAKRKFHSGCTI